MMTMSPRLRVGARIHIGQEACAVHRPIQQQRSRDPIVAQGSNEGRSFPMTMWHFANEPCTACSTITAGHVRGGAGFVGKHEPEWIKLGLQLDPRLTRCGHVWPVLYAEGLMRGY